MITYIIIAVTALVSIRCFSDRELFAKLMLNPYQVVHRKQYYRLVSHAFVHGDWPHLVFNMLTLFFFGRIAEQVLGVLVFLILYFGGMVFASLASVRKHRDNYVYNSVGASGAVSAALFASILFSPLQIIYVYFIPIPGILFAVIYMIYSRIMSRRNTDNINHDAHIMGAVYGFTLPILINKDYLLSFLDQINIFN